MIKPRDPRELVIDLLSRSVCAVQVGAVIADNWGIFGWGVNHSGFDGLGQHAEREAIRRSNRRRLRGAVIYVAAQRMRNRKAVIAKPCEECQPLIEKYGLQVIYRDRDGAWIYV